MSLNPFSFRNIFTGVVLGVLAVVVWLFHGEIWAYLQTQAPEMREIVRTAVREQRHISELEISGPTRESPGEPPPATMEEPGQPKSPAPVIEALEQELTASAAGVPAEAPAVNQEEREITLYPFRAFDSAGTARRFAESILKSTGVELQVERQGHRYVVLIPALDEAEKEHKAELIREKAGVTP